MRRSIQATLLVVATFTSIALQAVPAFASHTVTSASPSALAQGDQHVPVTLTGTGFSATPTPPSVTISGSGVSVDAGSVTVVNTTTLTMAVSVDPAAPENTDFTNDRTITVTQGLLGTDTATCVKCLHIGPVITSFSPPSTTLGGTGANTVNGFTVTGRGLHASGVDLKLFRNGIGFNGTENFVIDATGEAVSGCTGGLCTTVTGNFVVTGSTPGNWTVSATNKDTSGIGKSGTPFLMTASAPTFASTPISPTKLGKGAGVPTATPLDVFGTNLFKGMGFTFKLTGQSGADPNVIQLGAVSWIDTTHIQVPVQVKSAAVTGLRDIVMQNDPTNGAQVTCTACLEVTPGPTVSTVSPSTLGQGATAVAVAVTGTDFSNTDGTPTASFVRSTNNTVACDGVTISTVTFNSSTSLTLTTNVAPGATQQSCDLVVHNPDQGGFTKSSALAIAAGPDLVSVTPNAAPQGRNNLDLTFDGSGFHTGANKPTTADITFSGTGITVNSVTTNDPFPQTGVRLTVNVTIAQSAPSGARNVTVRNPDDKGQDTCASCFSVNVGPSITSVTPAGLGRGATSKVLNIVGTNFNNSPSPLTVAFSGSGVTVDTGGVQFVDAQHVNVTVSVASNADTGAHDVTVTNGDGGSTTALAGLTVTAAPLATSVTPSPVGQGAVNKTVTVAGSNFQQGIQPSNVVFSGGSDITVSSVTVSQNGLQITAVISVASNAATGAHALTITNPDFGTATCASCLSISSRPTIGSLSSSGAPNTAALTNFAVTGTNFASGATVQLERSGHQPIALAVTGTTGSTQIVGTLPLDNPYGSNPALGAAPGVWNVRVTNPDGGSIATPPCVPGAGGQCQFTVSSAAPTVPVNGINPNEVPVGGFLTITVDGTNFANGTTVDFGPGVLVGSVNVLSPTRLTADVNLSDASPGNADVKVINTDSQQGVCSQCLLISPAPTIDGMDPPLANPTGQTVEYTIFGSGFQSGATVFISPGIGITIGTPVVTSPNTIEVAISVDSDQPAGVRTLRVTNPDTGLAACFECFEIHTQGFWMDATDGGIFTGGSAPFLGSMGGSHLNQPIVGMAPLPGVEQGYWLVASDGGIFTFGAAQFYGSTGSLRLNKPIVGMAATPTGRGYWLVASDGGIFSFGDARFFGSTGALRLNKPVVGMAATPTAGGYWLVASDGGIFSFGDAEFFGSAGSLKLNQPIVGMAAMPDGGGYRFVAADGGIFNFGPSAEPLGSLGGRTISAPIVGIAITISGDGYWLAGADGRVYGFGDANDDISPPLGRLNKAVVGIATAP